MQGKKSNILITAPSFGNLSGITTLVATIMEKSTYRYRYFHFRLGRNDNAKIGFSWIADQILLLPRLIWVILKNKINIIHLNAPLEKSALIRDFLVVVAKIILKRRMVVHIHGGVLLINPPSPGSFFFILIKKMLREAHKVIVLSKLEAETIYQNYTVTCTVLPNAIDNIASYPDSKNFEDKLTFVFLGRIVKSKGIFLIADAFLHLDKYYQDFEFHIYGTGSELKNFIERLSQIAGLNFSYMDIARDAQKITVFKNAHILLLPSLYGEGLPLAMLEAMAGGCIPLVSDNASMPEVIRHNENGFIVQAGNKEDFIQAVADIINNRNKLPRISRSAHATILEKYTIEGYLCKLHNIYDDVVEKN